MASLCGTHFPYQCPVCEETVALPITAETSGSDYVVLTIDTQVAIDHAATHDTARRSSVAT